MNRAPLPETRRHHVHGPVLPMDAPAPASDKLAASTAVRPQLLRRSRKQQRGQGAGWPREERKPLDTIRELLSQRPPEMAHPLLEFAALIALACTALGLIVAFMG